MKYRLIIIIIIAIVLVVALKVTFTYNNDNSNAYTSTIGNKAHTWYVFTSNGGLTGNHGYIAISQDDGLKNIPNNSRYTFYTYEIYYQIDSCGILNIYAPYSAIKEPVNKDTTIIIHELKDYDSWKRVRNTFSSLGLIRLSISE